MGPWPKLRILTRELREPRVKPSQATGGSPGEACLFYGVWLERGLEPGIQTRC